ncbi:unnamed protein product [Auanema sp. JU1783]|nr:unnamed protein product [Auanema sp. JU1783]
MRQILLIAVIACGITVQKESSSKKEPSIAVIGAGTAGLSAARRLTELGLTDVDIYEGSTRIGGRIHPIPYYNGYLQMGAQFINGNDNPIYDIAKEAGVVEQNLLPDTAQFTNAEFLTGNQEINREDIELFKEFVTPLYTKYRNLAKNHDLLSRVYTFKTIFMEDYNWFLKKNNIDGERKKLMEALIRPYRTFWEFEWGGNWEDLSARVLAEFNQVSSEGDSYTTDHIGFKAIIDKIAEGIPEEFFKFNRTVLNINYGKDGVYIKTKELGEIEKRYDYVIVTSSLGHLKKFHKTLFTPSLPRQKVEAIEKIGFGGNCKIFFRWDKPFWKNGTNYISLLPIEGASRPTVDPFEKEMNTLEVLSWQPNTLMAFIAGAGHPLMDSMTDEEISMRITKLVRDMTSDQTIEPPSEIIRTKLTKNDLLLGSYSYFSAAQAKAGISHSRLAIPIKVNRRPRVLFAGEATHHRLFQTTVGAYLSGRREADRISTDIEKKDEKIKAVIDMDNCLYCKSSISIDNVNKSFVTLT